MSHSLGHISQNTRLGKRSRAEIAKKNLFKLKLTFPHDVPSAEQVKLLHPGIRRVITAAHETPKTKLSHHCFVEFDNKRAGEDALKSLLEKKVDGGVLLVHRVKESRQSQSLREQRRSLSGPGTGHRTLEIELIINHLPEDVQKADIKRAFTDCCKIKIIKKRRLASFCVPTLKSALTYLAQSVHTVKGHSVELISRNPLPKPTKPRTPKLKKPKDEKMDTLESDNTDEEMDETEEQKGSIVVEECF